MFLCVNHVHSLILTFEKYLTIHSTNLKRLSKETLFNFLAASILKIHPYLNLLRNTVFLETIQGVPKRNDAFFHVHLKMRIRCAFLDGILVTRDSMIKKSWPFYNRLLYKIGHYFLDI